MIYQHHQLLTFQRDFYVDRLCNLTERWLKEPNAALLKDGYAKKKHRECKQCLLACLFPITIVNLKYSVISLHQIRCNALVFENAVCIVPRHIVTTFKNKFICIQHLTVYEI